MSSYSGTGGADSLRILTLTNLYPNPFHPERATFNRQKLRLLATRHPVAIISPILWTEELAARWTGGRRLPRDRRVTCDGITVNHPCYVYPPKVLRGWYGHCFRESVRPAFRRALAEFRPDLIFAPWAYPDGWAAVQLGHRAGLPVVIKVHGSDILRLSLHPKRERGTVEALRQADGIVAVSRDLKERVVALGVDPGRVRVVYDGIDTERFHPGPREAARARLTRELDLQGPVVLTIGNLVPVKGLEVLIEAFGRLAGQGVDFTGLLIGRGPLRSRLEDQVARRGLRTGSSCSDRGRTTRCRTGIAPPTCSCCQVTRRGYRSCFWRPPPAARHSSPAGSGASPRSPTWRQPARPRRRRCGARGGHPGRAGGSTRSTPARSQRGPAPRRGRDRAGRILRADPGHPPPGRTRCPPVSNSGSPSVSRVSVFGIGYVGCVSAVCLCRDGHRVIGVEVDPDKVAELNAGHAPIAEPGLPELVRVQVQAGHLRATQEVNEAVRSSEIGLITVGTPSDDNGDISTRAVEQVVAAIGRSLRQAAQSFTIVVRSTLLPGILEEPSRAPGSRRATSRPGPVALQQPRVPARVGDPGLRRSAVCAGVRRFADGPGGPRPV